MSYYLVKLKTETTFLVIKSKRKIILPRIVFRLRDSINMINAFWSRSIIQWKNYSHELMSLDSCLSTIDKSKTKKTVYVAEYSLNYIKYIGPGTEIEIPLKIDSNKIKDIFLKTIDDKIYRLNKMDDEMGEK